MKYNSISTEVISLLEKIVGKNNVFLDEETRNNYGHDETEDFLFPPEVVVKPITPQEISDILIMCNKHHIPVTPIGAKTGLSGGALSLYGGIGLSMEKFNKIIEIDENNLQATVEPGVITQNFQEAVIKKGLYYPPDPASRGSCFIGGNFSENSGGPRALKYGVTKDFVLNLEVVLPDGNIMWTGANVLKNATGYNLTQLIVGSEGTLAIITKAVVKLIPYPPLNQLMLVPFYSEEDACAAVPEIFKIGVVPSAMEFMEREAIDMACEFIKDRPFSIDDNVKAHLLIEVDGNNEETLAKEMELIYGIIEKFNCGEVLLATGNTEKERLWKLRRVVGEAVKSQSIYKEEDTVVPRFALPQLIKGIKAVGKQYGFKSVCYGHAGDGNLHVNILKENLSDHQWNNEIPKAITEIFELTVKLKGTISGEHGIGYVQKDYMSIPFKDGQLTLMQKIKNVFDPNGILNPGKIFPTNN